MAVVFDLGNSAAWNLIYSENKVADTPPSASLNSHYPIPIFEVPIQFSSPIFAIFIDSESAEERWKTAGWIRQKVRTGILGGGQNDAFLSRKKVYLREINIIEFERVSSAYSVEINIPYWIRDVNLSIYEYTGLIADTQDEDIDELKALLLECCEDLKIAIFNSENTLEIVEKLNTIQNKLNECCDNGFSSNDTPEATFFQSFGFL